MKESWEKARLALGSRRAYGWREGTGPLRMAWESGAGPGTCPFSFKTRFFLPPGQKQNLWTSFQEGAPFRPSGHFEGEIPEAPAPLLFGLPLPEDLTTQEDWRVYCLRIEAALASGELAKLVPARATFHSFAMGRAEKLRAELLFRLFRHPQPGSYRFFVHEGDSTFFGASPELLFQRRKGKIFVPAIAGTRVVEVGAEEELMHSDKERAEHAFVVEGIAEALGRLGLSPRIPPAPTILRARNLIHLYTPIEADDENVPTDALISALHPTPAVGGTPRKAALAFLEALEPWNRGLFASPLLFASKEGETCIVGIRSGLLRPEGLYLFAGAGYVRGSHWEAEWNETARKMDSLRSLVKEGR